jgi:hypothetical protein
MTKKEMIIRTMCDHPHMNKIQIAERVGCHPAYVDQVERKWLKEEEFRGEWANTLRDGYENVERVDVQNLNTSGIDAVLDERGSRYGAFVTHAEITQRLKRVATKFLRNQGKELDFDQQEALDMVFHKIGRIINGDPDYADSWVDIAGYAKLVADRLEGKVR